MTDDQPPAEAQDEAAATFEANEPEPSIEALKAEIAQLKDQMLRVAADAENAKRRAEREANDARAYAINKFANDLLGVADNLARALQHAPRDAEDAAVKNLAIGLEMTEKALLTAFDRNGLKRVEPARGTRFDPHQHEAVMEQPADDVGPGAVLQVLQAGYELFGRLVRPAMVVVSSKASTGAAPSDPAQGANPYAHADGESDAGASVDQTA
ncbi:MAG: nucleotide exchange factor GrpE [Caulobacteraceae bacterium]|nr:nucleotide exchange factor GrpE [Caulobacteraceae bacterium]